MTGAAAAVVIVNRGGLASGVALGERNPYFAPYAGCFDLHGRSDALLAPCDDNATASWGAQPISLDLSRVRAVVRTYIYYMSHTASVSVTR